MATKTQFQRDAFAAIHSAARGLHRAGTIDKATLRDFDETCLAALAAIALRRSLLGYSECPHCQALAVTAERTSATVGELDGGRFRLGGGDLGLGEFAEPNGLFSQHSGWRGKLAAKMSLAVAGCQSFSPAVFRQSAIEIPRFIGHSCPALNRL